MIKNLLLIIDPQNDFVDSKGKLYVNKGEVAIDNLCDWIKKHLENIDDIIITQDTHTNYHVSHPKFWNPCPPIFSIIKKEDVGKNYKLSMNEDRQEIIKNYLDDAEKFNREQTIWPEHCILGSWGWCFPEKLVEVLNYWTINKNGRLYNIFQKGLNPWKESYSAFTNLDGTFNEAGSEIMDWIKQYDRIFIAGVAKDYCVAYSVEDIVNQGYANKLIFLNDCMAEINPNNKSLDIYDKAISNGAKLSYIE